MHEAIGYKKVIHELIAIMAIPGGTSYHGCFPIIAIYGASVYRVGLHSVWDIKHILER